MKRHVSTVRSHTHQSHRTLVWFGIPALIAFVAIVVSGVAGFRINFTPSEPLGLWRIVELDRELEIGDLVFICPPLTQQMRDARNRGYLRYGLCASGLSPLIKSVAARSGQEVQISDSVRIDGQAVPHSRVASLDGQGRQLNPYRGGIVPPGEIYLHSDFAGSFDSRYFGPLPASNVLGRAQEVWTYAP